MNLEDDDDDGTCETPRDSGTLAIFERTVEESITRLAGRDTTYADDLRAQARSLLTELHGWKENPPLQPVRAQTVMQVMDLYRAVLAYTTQRI